MDIIQRVSGDLHCEVGIFRAVLYSTMRVLDVRICGQSVISLYILLGGAIHEFEKRKYQGSARGDMRDFRGDKSKRIHTRHIMLGTSKNASKIQLTWYRPGMTLLELLCLKAEKELFVIALHRCLVPTYDSLACAGIIEDGSSSIVMVSTRSICGFVAQPKDIMCDPIIDHCDTDYTDMHTRAILCR
jgi:hypothetical protein